MKVSIQILAGNCADTIEQCLNSVLFADEIIIVLDTRHGDNTSIVFDKLCQWEYNNNKKLSIHRYDWLNDSFADARNFGLSKATGDIILLLDADEELTNFEMPTDNKEIYVCTVTKEGCTLKGIRMIKNGIGIKFYGLKHNQIENWGKYDRGESPLICAGFTVSTPEEIINKTNVLLEGHLRQLEEEPENQTTHFNLTRCHYGLEQWELVKETGHLALQDDIGDGWRAQTLIYLCIAYLKTNRAYTAYKWLERSVALLPDQLWGWCLMYERFFKAGDFEQAQKMKDIIVSTETSYLPTDMNETQTIELFEKLKLQEHESTVEC